MRPLRRTNVKSGWDPCNRSHRAHPGLSLPTNPPGAHQRLRSSPTLAKWPVLDPQVLETQISPFFKGLISSPSPFSRDANKFPPENKRSGPPPTIWWLIQTRATTTASNSLWGTNHQVDSPRRMIGWIIQRRRRRRRHQIPFREQTIRWILQDGWSVASSNDDDDDDAIKFPLENKWSGGCFKNLKIPVYRFANHGSSKRKMYEKGTLSILVHFFEIYVKNSNFHGK